MPVLAKWRKWYGSEEWRAIRRRIVVERAKNRCEKCGGEQGKQYLNRENKYVIFQLGCAHLDQNPANNADENLASLCRKCHLAHDQASHVEHSRNTRMDHKDGARPLLQEAARA